ncbi:MAG: hypothetical protein MUF27_16510 [Acidobacteria bacterium]|jgi:hypothetical protein|nr:hypothetical protein [Acidobacteriota bacterium]
MPNAFQINSADIHKGLFPLNFRFDLREDGIVDAFLCPQAIEEAADTLVRFGFPWLCVFGCSITYPEDLTLAETAASLDLDLRAISPEVIVLPTTDLGRLAEDTCNYNFSAIDWDDPDMTAIRRAVERLGRDDSPGGRCPLAGLPRSRVYLNSHDDCYLSVEWREPRAVRAHLGRLLAEYAVALLSDDEESPVSVAGPPDEVLQSIVAAGPCLTVLDRDTTREDSVLRIGCCHEKQYFPRLTSHEVSSILTYDAGSGAWSWARVPE